MKTKFILQSLWSYLLLLFILVNTSDAAEIDWQNPFTITSPNDVVNLGGPIHLAADFNPPETFNPDNGLLFIPGPFDGVINGIQFTPTDQNIVGLLDTNLVGFAGTTLANLAQGAANASTFLNGSDGRFYRGLPTGDSDLDNLLDSHAFRRIDGMADITIESLAVGTQYQVQLIGIADGRPSSASSVAMIDNGNGFFLPGGPTLQRGLYQTVLGNFTADSVSQTIQIDNSGGLSGIVVQAIPEPNATWFLALCASLGGMAHRNRRACR